MSHSNMVLSKLIGEIRNQLVEAHPIAKAADICVSEGLIDRAITISLDIEDLIQSTDNLLQVAATLNRSAREDRKAED